MKGSFWKKVANRRSRTERKGAYATRTRVYLKGVI